MLQVIIIGLLMAFPAVFLAVVGFGVVLLLLPYILILVSVVGLNLLEGNGAGLSPAEEYLVLIGIVGAVWSVVRHRKLALEFCKPIWEFIKWVGAGLMLGLRQAWLWWLTRA